MNTKTWLIAVIVALVPLRGARAQDSIPWPRGDRLTVTVSVREVQARGDTLRIRYRLASASRSEQSGELFAVRSGGVVVRVKAPLGWYASHGTIADSSVVDWSSLVVRMDLAPGKSLDGFEFEAVGALDVVSFLVHGHVQPPVVTDSTEGLLQSAPSVWADAFRGQTIGVVAVPVDPSPVALIHRLDTLGGRACGELGWIPSEEVCRMLRAKLAGAAASLAAGQTQAAAAQLTAYLHALDAQRGTEPGKHVSDSAYWLLKVNAEYVLAKL